MVPHELQATALAVFGQYVVRDMLGLEEAGHLAIASRFVAPITLVVSATQRAWAPFKLDVHAKDSDPSATLGAVVTYFLGFLLAVWVGVATLGPTVVAELLDDRYDRAADLVFVASLVPLALAIYMMAGTGFEIARDTRVLPLVSLGGLVVVVVATYLLVPHLAAEGAVLATIGGWIVMSVAVYFIARARFVVQYDALVLIGLVSVAASCAVLGRTSIAVAVVATVSFPLLAILVLCARSTHRARLRTFLARARGRRGEAAKARGERVT